MAESLPPVTPAGEPYRYELSPESLEALTTAVSTLTTVDGRACSLRPESVLQFWVWSQLPKG